MVNNTSPRMVPLKNMAARAPNCALSPEKERENPRNSCSKASLLRTGAILLNCCFEMLRRASTKPTANKSRKSGLNGTTPSANILPAETRTTASAGLPGATSSKLNSPPITRTCVPGAVGSLSPASAPTSVVLRSGNKIRALDASIVRVIGSFTAWFAEFSSLTVTFIRLCPSAGALDLSVDTMI